MAKKPELEPTTEKEVVVEKKADQPKKVWTEAELAVLPREEYLKAEADIKSGKASVKVD